jgi:hypothetical protein
MNIPVIRDVHPEEQGIRTPRRILVLGVEHRYPDSSRKGHWNTERHDHEAAEKERYQTRRCALLSV